MNVSGRLIEVVEEFEGSSVKGDVAAGATVIPLADLGDFAEDGLCSILDAPHAFVVDDDAGTLVVDPPLAADAGDGTPVYALTWDSKLQSELVAVVDLLDDAAGVARAEIPVGLRPMYSPGQALAGALVDLDTTEGGYVVAGSPMRGLDIDGSHIDPATLPASGPMTDGLPPTGKPILVLLGGFGYLSARWTEIDDPDDITYRLHIKEGGAPTTTGTYLVASGLDATSATVRVLADGTPVDPTKTYFGVVQVQDADGFGPVSDAVSTTPELVTTIDLDPSIPLSISHAQDVADDAQEVAYAKTSIYRSNEPPWPNGSALHLADTGDEWHDANNGNLPHRWDGSNWIQQPLGPGATTVDALAGKVVPVGSVTELAWGVADPDVAPRVTPSLPPFVIPPPPNGLTYTTLFTVARAATGRFWAVFGNPQDSGIAEVHSWMPGDASRRIDYAGSGNTLYGTTGGASDAWRNMHASNGLAVVGDEFVTFGAGGFRVLSIAGGFSLLRTVAPSPGYDVAGAAFTTIDKLSLDSDGSSLLVSGVAAYSDGAGGYNTTIRFWQVNRTTGAVSAIATTGGPADVTSAGQAVAGVFYAGADRIVVNGGNGKLYHFTRAGAHLPGETFDVGGQRTESLLWDGSNFVLPAIDLSPSSPLPASGTTVAGQTTTQSIDVVYTLVDSVTGKESAPSPAVNYSLQAHTGFAVSNITVPIGDDLEQPNGVYIYARTGANPFKRQHPLGNPAGNDLAAVPADGTIPPTFYTTSTGWGSPAVRIQTPIATTSATAPTSTTFDGAESGMWRSEKGGFEVRGDGVGAWPHLERRLTQTYDSRYAEAGHDHDNDYAPFVHNHDTKYAALTHTHSGYATVGDVNTEITARQNADALLAPKASPTFTGTTNGLTVGSGSVGTGTFRDSVDARVSAIAPTATMTTGSVGTGAFRDSVDARVAAFAQAAMAVGTATINPTSTTPVTIPGMTLTTGTAATTNATYAVVISADVQILTAGTVCVVDLLRDGVVQNPSIPVGGPLNLRVPATKEWVFTGVSGVHTWTVRASNTAASTSANVYGTLSSMTIKRIG